MNEYFIFHLLDLVVIETHSTARLQIDCAALKFEARNPWPGRPKFETNPNKQNTEQYKMWF